MVEVPEDPIILALTRSKTKEKKKKKKLIEPQSRRRLIELQIHETQRPISTKLFIS
jgi:hypothetical protein